MALAVDFTPGAVIPVDFRSTKESGPFVDLKELDEALELFYLGLLDFVNPIYACEPLANLVPGKPLISQLEDSDILIALDGVDSADRATLRAYHTVDREHYRGDYFTALTNLGKAVVKLL